MGEKESGWERGWGERGVREGERGTVGGGGPG